MLSTIGEKSMPLPPDEESEPDEDEDSDEESLLDPESYSVIVPPR